MFCDVQNVVIVDSTYTLVIIGFCMRVEFVMVLNVMIMFMGDVIVCSLVDKCHSFWTFCLIKEMTLEAAGFFKTLVHVYQTKQCHILVTRDASVLYSSSCFLFCSDYFLCFILWSCYSWLPVSLLCSTFAAIIGCCNVQFSNVVCYPQPSWCLFLWCRWNISVIAGWPSIHTFLARWMWRQENGFKLCPNHTCSGDNIKCPFSLSQI